MRKTLSSAFAATSLSLAVATAGATIVTFSGADTAFAKSENANGGNRGGNGNGNRGGENKGGGERGGAERGGGKPANAQGKAAERGNAQGKAAERGNGGSGQKAGNGSGASNRSGGGGKLFGLIPRHQPQNSRGGGNGGAAASAQRSAPATSARPAPRSAEDEDERIYGNSWKTRLDDGSLETHPSELGPWNSAKRSPQAVANMVEKYERTGDMSGAGGMIGYLVSSYWALDGEDGARTTYFSTLQTAVDDGALSVAAATRLFEGPPLTQEEFDALLESDDYAGIIVTDGIVSCDAGATCEDDDIALLQAELDALDFLARNDGAEGDYYDALEAAAEADATVVPNRSPEDDEIRQTMLEDVKDLLDIDGTDYDFEEPEAEGGEAEPNEET